MSFAHQRPGGVSTGMRSLSARGSALEEGWRADKSAIAGAESGIGGDLLGQAFGSVYTAPGEAARLAADKVGPAMLADARVGMRCAEDYLGADEVSAASMPVGEVRA
ncbi:hypothetical protein [Crossiella sp. CA198]|uniref:hypothetical protein n=1 Tax=Crossiella sp. CA198 TaxID=3455607 RepID=UPI003F8D325E